MLSKTPKLMYVERTQVPPALKKGSEIPITGLKAKAMPMFTADWKKMNPKIPTAIKHPRLSLASFEIFKILKQ